MKRAPLLGAIALSIGLLGAVVLPAGPSKPPVVGDQPGNTARARTEPIEEALEQQEVTADRLAALAASRARGTFGLVGPIGHITTEGWGRERPWDRRHDDWEPTLATDPTSTNVYQVVTRFGGPKACGRCPDPAIVFRRSIDGGRHFTAATTICRCRGWESQYDPQIQVTARGDVYAVWMNEFNVHFSRSMDEGRTWSRPVSVIGAVRWSDKPSLVTNRTGLLVLVTFNGPTAGDLYVARSTDGGITWPEPVRVREGRRYHFTGTGAFMTGGTVVFSAQSFNQDYTGRIRFYTLRSTDRGQTWTWAPVHEAERQPDCTSRGCYDGYYAAFPSLAADRAGNLVFVYAAASRPAGPQTVYVRWSGDGGATWSTARPLSSRGANGVFAAVAGVGDGDFRIWFMDDRQGTRRWNVWFRRSTDGGLTWTRAVRISNGFSGADYKHPRGFDEPYGDYGGIAIDGDGRTHALWGESVSYTGPGGAWYNRSAPMR